MKKLIVLSSILSACFLADINAYAVHKHNAHAVHKHNANLKKHAKNSIISKKTAPNYYTGAFNFYNSDVDPTTFEPDIIPALLESNNILFWKNSSTGSLSLLVNAIDNGDGTYTLTWNKIAFESVITYTGG